ncbi:IS481 family transposase [Burkholderia sp. HI2714]|uniref:DDE-type integrase/transposase/recombinase n=1 Tax=Burkholderia sp. HI2714 TaxID=2015359 RepID=UPI000B7A6C07|nr:DDE-type integrase/transposase/recombinase [Burkholderia sp. HI2714]OXJ22547.1 IS481 family transposase [Burkholderia sp. HI2714]
MTERHDSSPRDRWARLRFAIIGPLLAAPPEPGQLHELIAVLAAKCWRHPITGADVRFGRSTIERWYYKARRAAQDPVASLKNRKRPRGVSRSLAAEAIQAISAQYREHPGWTCQLHYDNLKVTLGASNLPSYATVRRYFVDQGLIRVRKPRHTSAGAMLARDRLEKLEVRSFEVEHVNALWHLDFHHGSRKLLTRDGEWVTPMLLGVLDDRSRVVCHAQWFLDESARSLVHGLSQAFARRSLPRALMTDNGAAMLAEETTAGLHTLGVLHQTTLPYSPYQNAKQETFWARIEGRVMAMLEGEPNLTLDLLNQATHAWIEREYHHAHHSEIGTTPLKRYLAGPNVGRESPSSAALRSAFRIDATRTQRRSDGTVSLAGTRFEIPSAYRHLQRVRLRYARWDLSRVDLVDADSGTVLYPLRPLDKAANADGQRRRLEAVSASEPSAEPPGVAPLMRQLLAEHAATGLPPAWIPADWQGDRA